MKTRLTPAQIAHRIQFVLLTEVRPEHRITVIEFVRAHLDQRGELLEVTPELEKVVRDLEAEE